MENMKLRMAQVVKTPSTWYLFKNKGSQKNDISANHRPKLRFHSAFSNKQALCYSHGPCLLMRGPHTSQGSYLHGSCVLQKHTAGARTVSRKIALPTTRVSPVPRYSIE